MFVIIWSAADTPQPDVLYTKVVEVEERVTPEWTEHIDDPPEDADALGELVEGVNKSKLRIVEPLSGFPSLLISDRLLNTQTLARWRRT